MFYENYLMETNLISKAAFRHNIRWED